MFLYMFLDGLCVLATLTNRASSDVQTVSTCKTSCNLLTSLILACYWLTRNQQVELASFCFKRLA